MNLKKTLLIMSFGTITVIGLLYGVAPAWFFKTFLTDTPAPSIDQSHIMRAVMMLYIGLGGFWLFSAFSEKYRDAGIIVVGVFCTGLVSGRILSILIDGKPSPILILYVVLELGLIPACLWLLKRDKS